MTDATQQTVFIVDDEVAILDSLRMLMVSENLHVETFTSAQAFINSYTPDQSGCLLLDIRMPVMSGLELQQHLNRQQYFLPIIFITGHGDVPMVVNAIKNGAEDFIQKPFKDNELLKKIELALKKDRQQRDKEENISQLQKCFHSLTPREREVMEKMIIGDASKVIAYKIGISQRTVDIHRAHVMKKTQAKSLAELVTMATKLKLAE
ncbi:DNA-binding response regulator [Candidatus Endobugula sertula]|uniref:DNA-binding response regulator n=1 Tax=Candidatus Endobugula sertula TaxID=62101 RepID=A0A1D2QRJ3_9GAMM|nr:DNA-binding response regulator [Candidatus Endobugula sertula]